MSPGWADIPSDLLYIIDEELAYIEKVRVRATCVWWNSALPKMPNHKLPQLPWLLHTNVDNDGRKSQALFNLCEEKDYKLDLPQLEGKFLKGSTHGWLVTISVNQNETSPSSPDICLLNPLTGVQVQLPPRSTLPDVEKYYPDRVGLEYRLIDDDIIDENDYLDIDSNHVHRFLNPLVVTSSSCIEDCVAVATYSGVKKVAWCMLGHDEWTALDIYSYTSVPPGAVVDIIFSNNKFYVLNGRGYLLQVEFTRNLDPVVKVIVGQPLPRERGGEHLFVVEGSDGRLRLAVRRDDAFEVSELDLENSCWRFTNNMANDMLFLGYNHSLSVPACQFPGYSGNRVYFADDHSLYSSNFGRGDALIAMFNLSDGGMKKLAGFSNIRRSLLPQPIWVMPPSYG